ncbi:replicative DNA helicase [Corynebacterium durum]|mgnify:FL=1|jgi:replicative DNA helicase|uniref:replicative DNA helicase n=1 Tax=Corynebacterium durum TaxID=61592 RepID=UPI0015CAA64E|nr:replicative DNA helicase [Corynebacterium durum]NYI74555.1 replicative DNA helicase [Corynebacterium durum]WJY86271.1 Replicative DNA helicase [Corynebacterium durum]
MDSGFSESFSESHFDDSSDVAATSFDDVVPSAPSQQASFERPSTRGDRGRYGQQGGPADPPGRDFGRQPPHDNEAEQGVLGAMLLSPNTITDIIEELIPDDFYRPAHQLIYRAILDLFSDNKDVDPVIVAGRLDRNHDLERVGGAPYLHTLISSVPTAANARYYAEIVAEKAVLRRLVDAGTRVVQLGYEGTEGAEVDVVVDMAQQEVFAIAQRNVTEDYAILADILQPTMDELDELSTHGGLARGIPTGFIDLDNLTNGLHGGQMIIVAARPGVGKSTLALDFMRSCSIKHNKASVIFSLEMSKSEIVMRLLSAETEIRLSDMRAGRMSDEAWAKLANRVGQISEAPLFIDDSANLTMMEIRSKARRLKQKHDLQMIVVDYLQLMSSGKRVESRQQEVSEFSRQLKLLAKELDVPLVAISQLNRGPESRTDKRPQLADLRESGSLEQDADMVMLLYRPDSQDKDDERAGEADIILAKHRGGPIDTVQVAHQLHYSKFVDMARG